MNPTNDLIHLEAVKFRYPKSRTDTLIIPEFRMKKEEKIFLFGPSGCGKSTFLELLAGVLTPQQGDVKILGYNLSKLDPAGRDRFRSQHVGYVFQSFNLIPYLSVVENIELPIYLCDERRKKLTDSDIRAEMERLTSVLGIQSFLYRRVTHLSVGQQQRVAVARALLGNPELILADEPTSSLDYDHREKFIKLLFELCEERGTSVLFVSHDRSLEKLFDRSLSLADINEALK